MQVRKLLMAGYDMRKVTGDDISKEDYVKAQQEVSASSPFWPPLLEEHLLHCAVIAAIQERYIMLRTVLTHLLCTDIPGCGEE